MNIKATIPTAILAGLMVLSVFACCSSAVAEATAPTWELGDGWATGFEKDLGAEFADEISNIEEELQDLAEIEVEEFDADGNVEFYVVFEVAEETSTYYTLTADMGQKLLFTLDVEVTASLPDEGTYDMSEEPDTSEKTITLGASIDYALWTHADIQIVKETMAIESIGLELHGSAVVEASVTNFPNMEYDWDGSEETMTVSYENMEVWLGADVNIDIDMDFIPSLDIFQFPFDSGDEWTVSSNATISGTIDGSLDVTGLPPEATEDMFSDDVMVANGITGFPIELDQLVIDEEDGPQITNGVFESQTVPIEFELACVGSNLVTLPNYGQVQVYILETEEGQRFNYSSDIKFMTSMEMDFADLFGEMGPDVPFEMPEDTEFMDENDMAIGSVSVATAQSSISEIADYQGGVSEGAEDGPSGNDDMNDFFFKAPYFGIIIIVLVVVIVISVAFAAVKKK